VFDICCQQVSGNGSREFYKRRQLFLCSRNETLSVAPDRARIVFDCRMADDPAVMSSGNPGHVQEVRRRNEKSS